MHPCSAASQRGENSSFAFIRQALCCDRQASAQGSASADSAIASASTVKAATYANPFDLQCA
jgi:hypothetical protein